MKKLSFFPFAVLVVALCFPPQASADIAGDIASGLSWDVVIDNAIRDNPGESAENICLQCIAIRATAIRDIVRAAAQKYGSNSTAMNNILNAVYNNYPTQYQAAVQGATDGTATNQIGRNAVRSNALSHNWSQNDVDTYAPPSTGYGISTGGTAGAVWGTANNIGNFGNTGQGSGGSGSGGSSGGGGNVASPSRL